MDRPVSDRHEPPPGGSARWRPRKLCPFRRETYLDRARGLGCYVVAGISTLVGRLAGLGPAPPLYGFAPSAAARSLYPARCQKKVYGMAHVGHPGCYFYSYPLFDPRAASAPGTLPAEACELASGRSKGPGRLHMAERLSWHQYFMTITRQVAERSTCNRAKVGAVIVRDKNILATGYNGAPAGMPHCTDVGCLIYQSKTPNGETGENCFRTIHAEM